MHGPLLRGRPRNTIVCIIIITKISTAPYTHTHKHTPVNNSVEVVAPDLNTVVVPGRDVAYDVNFLPPQLGRLQLVHEPLQLVGGVLGVEEQPPAWGEEREVGG